MNQYSQTKWRSTNPTEITRQAQQQNVTVYLINRNQGLGGRVVYLGSSLMYVADKEMPYGQFRQVEGYDGRSVQRQERTKTMVSKPCFRPMGSEDVPELGLQRLLPQLRILRRRPLAMDTRIASRQPTTPRQIEAQKNQVIQEQKECQKRTSTHCRIRAKWNGTTQCGLLIRMPAAGLISKHSSTCRGGIKKSPNGAIHGEESRPRRR